MVTLKVAHPLFAESVKMLNTIKSDRELTHFLDCPFICRLNRYLSPFKIFEVISLSDLLSQTSCEVTTLVDQGLADIYLILEVAPSSQVKPKDEPILEEAEISLWEYLFTWVHKAGQGR
jgi:hypothetical protein